MRRFTLTTALSSEIRVQLKRTDIQEIESNLFAAELLMPAEFLREDLKRFGTLDLLDEHAIDYLARRYGVSNHAMAIRLSSLGHITI
jgi:Zn-dependent peptidase ImmA (M78 family)